jgi:hypothetical protein
MRFYELTITPADSTTPIRTWSSYPNGIYDPGALQVEFDVLVAAAGTPTGASSVTVHGIPLQDLSQAYQFAGMTLELKGGMKAGLPLVNPAQAGTILKGQIFQSFGNWEGTEQRIDFVVLPSQYTTDDPGNIVLNWPAGTPLSQALKQTFSIAYPGSPTSINISGNLVQAHNEVHFCPTLDQFAQTVAEITEGNFGNRVNMGIQGGQMIAYDSSYAPMPMQLAFTDFVGQPTWIALNTIQIKMVLRADLNLGGIIAMPQGLQNLPGFVTTTANSYPSNAKYQTTFQNNFTIQELRQIGNFRSKDAAQWATVANCVTNG